MNIGQHYSSIADVISDLCYEEMWESGSDTTIYRADLINRIITILKDSGFDEPFIVRFKQNCLAFKGTEAYRELNE